MQIEIGANLLALGLGFFSSVGVIVTSVLSYFNGRKIKEVAKNTNGMTEKLVAAAFKDGKDFGISEERRRSGEKIPHEHHREGPKSQA